jgi:hypothetical protein
VVGDEVVKKSDIYTFRVMDSLTGEGEPPEAYESWLEHLTHLAAEAMAEVLDIEGIVTDKTLTVDGGIADGKATGDALALKADKSTTYTKTEVDQMISDVEVETDTTLAVSGAPADAAETGRQFGLIKADLGALDSLPSDIKAVDNKTKVLSVGVDSADIYVSHGHPTSSSAGVTWVDDDTFTLDGTPSSGANPKLFMNLLGTTSSVPVAKGETYTIKLEVNTDTSDIEASIWVKHTDNTTESLSGHREVSYKVRSDDKALMFRIGLKTRVQITATCKVTIAKNITPLLSDNANAETGIAVRLSTFGRCILGKGIFTISNGITMPANSLVKGYGKDTIVRYTGNGVCFVMGDRCTIRDLTLQGSDEDLTLPDIEDTISTKHAIEWTGETVQFGTVDSCIIERFEGSAIYAHDTGTPVDRNLLISNCILRNNGLGVYIRKDSEFNKIVNCGIVKNTYGILNRGGNNIVDNCGIDANKVGIKVDADEGSNNGHGNISNCTVNHSNNNEGYGLMIDGTGRMIVSNCNFYFSKIRLANGNGNIVNGCGFGNNAIIEVAEGASNRVDIICNCMMRSTSNAINVYSGVAKVSNCWTREGIEVTATPVSS